MKFDRRVSNDISYFGYHFDKHLTLGKSNKILNDNQCPASFPDIFSQISDGNGHLGHAMFSEYLKEALTLPAAVYESPSFPYTEHLASSIFDGVCQCLFSVES